MAASSGFSVRKALKQPFLLFCFFVSGATSLALETAWSKELSYLLGNDLYGAATTIIAYMGGLGFGAWLAARYYHRVKSPLATYALLQILIGAFGLISISMLRSLHPFMALVHGLPGGTGVFLATRLVITFLTLLPATTLMGMTLPIVLGAYNNQRDRMAAHAGRLYGSNTFGALAGALLAGLILIPHWGLQLSCIRVALLDLVLALLLFAFDLWYKKAEKSEEPTATKTTVSTKEKGIPLGQGLEIRLSYALIGAVALGLELCWFRLLSPVIGPTTQAFSITLAVYLLGTAAGSTCASPIVGRVSPKKSYPVILALAGIAAVTPLFYLEHLPSWYKSLWSASEGQGTRIELLLAQSVQACALIFPGTFALGAAFPLAVDALSKRVESRVTPSVLAANLFYWNTFGAVVGTISWGFFIIPQWGVN
ncbi:MAG: hypothetical protein MK135_16560, partial [Polyangiaceae bacterium]|nr:hypothetical protein [Polyangiaceae bacterium]